MTGDIQGDLTQILDGEANLVCCTAGGDVLTRLAPLGQEQLGVTLEPVYCLGLCATGPAAMIDGRVVARVDEKRLDALLSEVGA